MLNHYRDIKYYKVFIVLWIFVLCCSSENCCHNWFLVGELKMSLHTEIARDRSFGIPDPHTVTELSNYVNF